MSDGDPDGGPVGLTRSLGLGGPDGGPVGPGGPDGGPVGPDDVGSLEQVVSFHGSKCAIEHGTKYFFCLFSCFFCRGFHAIVVPDYAIPRCLNSGSVTARCLRPAL